jgi:hypothetical protein
MLEELQTDLEKAQYLQNMLTAHATGNSADEGDYQLLRQHFVKNQEIINLLPTFITTSRNLFQFWEFIKYKFRHYAERRQYIWNEFEPLLSYLENRTVKPIHDSISDALKQFDEDGVHSSWERALKRLDSDPEGAITAARTLLETVCKHILDEQKITYDANKIELHELYKLTAKELNLSPSQHTEDVFKKILGGCSSIINGLGMLRNRLGDAHGKGKKPIRPAPRHAELAVNLAGSMSLFLVSTWEARNKKP